MSKKIFKYKTFSEVLGFWGQSGMPSGMPPLLHYSITPTFQYSISEYSTGIISLTAFSGPGTIGTIGGVYLEVRGGNATIGMLHIAAVQAGNGFFV
jgi:hypothetical protein